MPFAAPRVCSCGKIVPSGQRCACSALRKRESDRRRPTARKRGYTAEWDKARAEFLAVNPVCRMFDCGKPASIVDHIEAHKGNMKLFWNKANWQPLCVTCHSGRKQSIERHAESCGQ